LTFSDVQADVKEEVTDSDKVTYAGAWNPEFGAVQYSCAGDVLRWSPGQQLEMKLQRRG
jgi:hypothetical protein